MPNRAEFKFEITYGPAVANAAGEKEILMTVVCRNKKGTLIKDFDISVESGGVTEQKKTDPKGIFQFTAKCPAGTNEIAGKFLYKKGGANLEFPWKHDLTVPSPTTAPASPASVPPAPAPPTTPKPPAPPSAPAPPAPPGPSGPAVLTTIKILPAVPLVAAGCSQQFEVEGYDQYGNIISADNPIWSSSDRAVGSIDCSGLFRAHAAGSVTINATIRDINGARGLNITQRVPLFVEVLAFIAIAGGIITSLLAGYCGLGILKTPAYICGVLSAATSGWIWFRTSKRDYKPYAITFKSLAIGCAVGLMIHAAGYGLKPATKTSATSAASSTTTGKILNIELKPGEIYNVDDVRGGQQWRFLAFNGAFDHRIDKGDGRACWKEITNNKPWSADCDGKLQLRAGNTPVSITVNVL